MAISSIFVLPTTQCPGRPCSYCFYETGHLPRVAASDFLAPLDLALDRLLDAGLQQVIITGGEPLCSPLLPRLLELCASKLLHLLLLTRGDLLDEPTLERLEKSGLDDLVLSAFQLNEPLRQAVQLILFHSRYVPTMLTTLTQQNVPQVPELLAFSAQYNLPHLFIPAYLPKRAADYQQSSLKHLSAAQWQRLITSLTPWAEQNASMTYLQFLHYFYCGTPIRPFFCIMGTESLVIDADGAVYPCFHRRDLPVGNLLCDPWPQIQERLLQLSPVLIEGPCFGEHCLSLFSGRRDPIIIPPAAEKV